MLASIGGAEHFLVYFSFKSFDWFAATAVVAPLLTRQQTSQARLRRSNPDQGRAGAVCFVCVHSLFLGVPFMVGGVDFSEASFRSNAASALVGGATFSAALTSNSSLTGSA